MSSSRRRYYSVMSTTVELNALATPQHCCSSLRCSCKNTKTTHNNFSNTTHGAPQKFSHQNFINSATRSHSAHFSILTSVNEWSFQCWDLILSLFVGVVVVVCSAGKYSGTQTQFGELKDEDAAEHIKLYKKQMAYEMNWRLLSLVFRCSEFCCADAWIIIKICLPLIASIW